jgi:hypothetical protein
MKARESPTQEQKVFISKVTKITDLILNLNANLFKKAVELWLMLPVEKK